MTALPIRSALALVLLASGSLYGAAGCAPAEVDGDEAAKSEAALGGYPAKPADTAARKHCDVIIAGGSTAAIAAAVASADVGAKTCLLEPTEWIGGQLTASAVSAVDWAWHKVGSLDVGAADKARENVTPNFFAMMAATGNPGGCWVSKNCYEPKALLSGSLGALANRYAGTGQLVVLKNTVIKRVVVDGGKIKRMVAVQRTPKTGVGWGGYDRLPSQDLPDWYEERASARYDKQVIELSSGYDRPAVFIDATDWGELLALSGAAYVQGVESSEGSLITDEKCGQSTVFPFVEKLNGAAVADIEVPEATPSSKAFYSLSPGAGESVATKWDKVFRYRRIRGSAATAQAGDLSLQNWNPGNDYPFGYLFMSKSATAAQRSDWRGGVDLNVMAGAERHAYGWHTYFKQQGGVAGSKVTLDTSILGTGHGLSKLPYIRDTRRSVGLDGFSITSRDLLGPASQVTGTPFPDRVAIGAYAIDIHGLSGCT